MHRDLPPPKEKNFPAGTMMFNQEKSNTLVVLNGLPYSENGKALPNDLEWLRINHYCLSEEAVRALVPPKEKVQHKNCTDCGSELPLKAGYCMMCGTAQRVWTPGSGGLGEDIAKFINSAPNPLGAVLALQNPLGPAPAPRETVEQLGPNAEWANKTLTENFSDWQQASLEFAPLAGAAGPSAQPFVMRPVGPPIPMPAIPR